MHDLKKQLEIISTNDTTFKYWLDQYKYFDRYPKYNKEYYQKKCSEFLSLLETNLGTNSFILNNNMGLADVAIFPFIRQCHNVDTLWFSNLYPNLKNWLTKFIESKLFNSVMNKYDFWIPKQSPLVLNF